MENGLGRMGRQVQAGGALQDERGQRCSSLSEDTLVDASNRSVGEERGETGGRPPHPANVVSLSESPSGLAGSIPLPLSPPSLMGIFVFASSSRAANCLACFVDGLVSINNVHVATSCNLTRCKQQGSVLRMFLQYSFRGKTGLGTGVSHGGQVIVEVTASLPLL